MVRLSRELATAGARLADASGMLRLFDRLGSGSSSQIHVLVYHRVARSADGPSSLCRDLVSATPDDFATQMMWLREHHAVVSLDELVDAVRGVSTLPRRAVLITFDDAYADFADNAWPVLKGLGLPAAMFVPTAFPGDPDAEFWWERLHRAVHSASEPSGLLRRAGLPVGGNGSRLAIYRQLRDQTKALPHADAMALVDELCDEAGTPARARTVLGWDELRALARQGLRLCAHTRTHPMLDRIGDAEIRAELSGSLTDLTKEIGEAPPVFAYPGGAFNRSVVRITQELGFRVGFTTKRGVADLTRDHPLELPRIPVSRGVTLPIFKAQLLSQFASLNGLWK
jgi:peptidoglycan/xylan/chitin deacetylase (PgdA/CDA1 family)